MTAKQLKNSILQQAIQGKLIKQNKEDEPASELLKRIKAEREKLIKSGKIKINKNISAIYRKGNSFYEKIENEEICIDEELPFEIPKTWEWVRFSELIYLINGTSYSKSDISNNGIRIIRGGNIQENRLFIFDDDVFISKDYFDKDKNIKKGDIIIVASTGSKAIIGKPAFINENYKDIQIGAFLRIIRSYSLEIVDYINIIFQSYYYREHIRNKVKGTNINNIKPEYIENLIIPLPPIEEQKRIVNKLNQLMPLIEEYEEKENKLNELDKKFPERLKKSILKEAFDGKLIKSYNKKTLEEICIYSTSNIAIKDIKNKKGNYPVYGASGIIGYVDFYSKEKECVAVVKDGSIGKVFLLPAKSSVISTLCYLENIEILNIKYLYYFLQSINFIKYKKGSMIPHIYFKDYKKEKVIIPPIEEQKRIVEKLDKLINACEELKKILFI